jgi:hypothetical protein
VRYTSFRIESIRIQGEKDMFLNVISLKLTIFALLKLKSFCYVWKEIFAAVFVEYLCCDNQCPGGPDCIYKYREYSEM